MQRISLLKQVRLFVDAYHHDEDFQLAFGKEVKIKRFHLFLIFWYFCSFNRLYGYPTQAVFESGKVVGIINYQNGKKPLDCTIWDVQIFKLFKFLYYSLLNSKIRTRLDRHTEISYKATSALNTFDLCQIGVRKKAQGKGYIRELLSLLEERVKCDENIDSMTVTAFSKNKCRMYESLGFKLDKYTEDSDTKVWVLTKEVRA